MALAIAVLAGDPAQAYAQTRPVDVSEEAQIWQLDSEVQALIESGKYGAAITVAERLLALREKALGPDHPHVGISLSNLAELYRTTGDHVRPELLYGRALKILEKAPASERLNLATTLNNLGVLHYARGDYARAESLYRRALELRESILGPAHPDVGISYNNLALVFLSVGHYAQADSFSRRALAIVEKALGPDHRDVAMVLTNIAAICLIDGDFTQAESHARRALAIKEEMLGEEHPALATSLNNLAEILRARGDYVQAEALLRDALAIMQSAFGPEHPDVAMSLSNLGGLCYEKGDYAQAVSLSLRALEMREKLLGPEHPDVAMSLNNIAQLYRVNGQLVLAEFYHQRAIAMKEKVLGSEHPGVATSLNNLGEMYRMRGDLAQAEPMHRRALAIREKSQGPDHPDVATVLNSLAVLHDARGDYAQAEPLYRRALAMREKLLGPEHPDVAVSLSNLATMYLARGTVEDAIMYQERAAAIYDRNATAFLLAGAEEHKRAFMATLRGDTFVAVSMQARFAQDDRRAARLALGVILSRKARVLDAVAGLYSSMRRQLEPEERLKLERLRTVSARYSTLVWRGQGAMPLDEYHRTLIDLDEERRTLEADLSRRSARLQVDLRPVRLDAVQAAIPEGAALVELFRYMPFNPKAGKTDDMWGKPRYAAYVLPRSGEIAWADLGEAAPIEAAVDALLPALRRAAADPAPHARALDALIMQPIRRLLGDTRWVFLSPDGKLNLVPFAALRDEDGRYLVERYSFNYLTSGRDLLRLRATSPSPQGPVILAAPDFDNASKPSSSSARVPTPASTGGGQRSADMGTRSFGPLPYAAEEGRALQARAPEAALLTGPDATETAVKALRGPRFLHVATHGFFLPDEPERRVPFSQEMGIGLFGSRGGVYPGPYAENPLLRSGLVFAGVNKGRSGTDDGVLTALEAAQLDLGGTKLVVLSACETGVGEARSGEGVYGLRRALVIAGAETQVMSLWKVDDAATRELMEKYYVRLLAGGGRTEALREVQLDMLRRPDRAHPYYWASFIGSGNPAAIDGRPVAPDIARVQPGPRGCACEVGAGSGSSTGAWPAAIAALGLVSSLSRRRASSSAAHSPSSGSPSRRSASSGV